MNALLTFSVALSDSNRLRILGLLQEHKCDFEGIREVLDITAAELASHVKLLSDAGLLKDDKSGKQAKIKHKHAALLEKVFHHFKINPKKDSVLAADLKKLRQLHEKKRPKKAAKKPAVKKKAAKKK